MSRYNFAEIEHKWQANWAADAAFVAPLDTIKCTQYVTTDSAERPVSDTRNQPW